MLKYFLMNAKQEQLFIFKASIERNKKHHRRRFKKISFDGPRNLDTDD